MKTDEAINNNEKKEDEENKKKQQKSKKKSKKQRQIVLASEDMIPLFCYTIVQSRLPSLHAEIAFINDFMNEEDEQMELGYALSLVFFSCTNVNLFFLFFY